MCAFLKLLSVVESEENEVTLIHVITMSNMIIARRVLSIPLSSQYSRVTDNALVAILNRCSCNLHKKCSE